MNEFSDISAEKPGFCPYVEPEIVVSPDFKPKRLEYCIPVILKPEIQQQIDELPTAGFKRPSSSPMTSPIVAVLKGPMSQGGVRQSIDFRYLNLIYLFISNKQKDQKRPLKLF